MEAAGNVSSIPRQLSLIAGGATVDVAEIGGLSFSAKLREIEREIPKGSDVQILIVARCVGVDIEDKYDAHGNVSATIRKHDLRIDELGIEKVTGEAYQLAIDDPPTGDDD